MPPFFLGVDFTIIGSGTPSVKQQLRDGGGMLTGALSRTRVAGRTREILPFRSVSAQEDLASTRTLWLP
jgi:hypothetical protein